ncbi:uncharacterized protein LOC135480293 [Liolophura sinensis]|uniref:uncharacterized protein LOC135480293 n=1 Tax=Liolophura sinensis TaxID=3198878 RepID=UPI003158696D
MDDWLTNTAGAVPGDGAFERFLTAALAAIITLVFSWRLLGEVSESDREAAVRRHAAARASGQYTSSQLGISDEKLREVAEAFAKDRVEKLKADSQSAGDGSCVDTNVHKVDPEDPVGATGRPPNELSQELSAEDKLFLEDLLKSSLDAGSSGDSAQTQRSNSPAEGVSAGNELPDRYPSGNECVSQVNDTQSSPCLRMSDLPLQASSDTVTDSVGIATTTTPEDSDEEDDFQDYFDENINPRVLDSDEETYYRTFLEPIQEELSGEDRGSSSEEWEECGETVSPGDGQELWCDTPTSQGSTQSAPKQSDLFGEASCDVGVEQEVQVLCDNSFKMLTNDVKAVSASDVGFSESRVFDAYQTSPDRKLPESSADDTEITDDSVSEESDDTVIMVFSNIRNGEEDGNKQSQNEIVYLNQERYRDMFMTEKFEEVDSDDDVIIPPSKHYDQIRNNLTLIGDDDGENLRRDYDDYERGSWSDPDDNFRCSIPRWNGYGGFGMENFEKQSDSDELFSYHDDSFTWKSFPKNDRNAFKPYDDFDFNQNTPKGYDDAPFSNAAEESPVGFTFVEVKDSFTEFSLRNYVRDKEHFDPKSDSGIFTDSEEFTVTNSVGKSTENESQTEKGDELNRPVRAATSSTDRQRVNDTDCGHALNDSALDIDLSKPSGDQYKFEEAKYVVDKSPSVTDNEVEYPSLDMTSKYDIVTLEAETLLTCKNDDEITSAKIYGESLPRTVSDTPSDLTDELESTAPGPDNVIDAAFSFQQESCVDDIARPEDSQQTLPNSCQLRSLEQTEITCWSSHTELLPQSCVDVESDRGYSGKGVDAESVPVDRSSQIKLEYKEIVRSKSPVSSQAYYNERQRRIHDEAVLLDQVIAPDSELSSDHKYINTSCQHANPAAVRPYYTRIERESGVDPLPWEHFPNTENTSPRFGRKQTDIDCISVSTDEAADNRVEVLSDRSVNGYGIALDGKTTPKSITAQAGVDSVMEPGDSTCDTIKDSGQESEIEVLEPSERNNRDSIILEESPVICMTPKTGDENVFENTTQNQRSTSDWDNATILESGINVTLPSSHTPDSGLSTTSNSQSTVVLETGSKETLPTNQSPTSPNSPHSRNDVENPAMLDRGSRFTLPRRYNPESPASPGSPSSLDSRTTLDRGTRVTLPRRYTPSADYRKLLKPTTPRRYTSVLQRPISTEKLQMNYSLPDRPVPKIRKKILASRQRFLSEDNLCSPNDSFEDAFSDYSSAERFHPQARRSISPTSPTNRQSYSVADISRLYASTMSSPRKPRPCIDQLHENCILSPERLALLRSRAFSTESIGPRRVSRQPSVSSLVETDIDTGETSETPQFTETDLDVPFRLQTPVEKTVSMMDLRSGRSRFAARKKAAEEKKKSKSLQQLGTNIGSLETDIDAPFPDGSGVTRIPSEHELRVTKSLSKLNVPDWLRRSTVFRTGSHFILRRDSNASTISQWSSKSYGPLATTRDSSRASSCVTLSQPSPVVIRTRVQPSSPGRLIGSPSIGSSSKSNYETRQVKLPSAKFREREKPSGLMPIPIVPFEQLRAKFEKNGNNYSVAQERKEPETKIIVEPMKNPPPGILKQSQPGPVVVNSLDMEPAVIDRNKVNQSPPNVQARPLPPKITITSEKNISPKDKTSPSAFEKSVRFSPILNRMDLSSGPDVLPPSPEEDYYPANGGAAGKKPILPPKPAKKLLKWKPSSPGNDEVQLKSEKVVTKPEKPEKPEKPQKPEKPEKPTSKPSASEKSSRIANLIRRFKETTV